MRVLRYSELTSTNAKAKRLAMDGDRGPLWVLTERQTHGRGRRGRSWLSCDGNLYCSALHAVDGSAADAAKYSFVAALAVYDTAKKHAKGKAEIKWPNDVLLGRKKLAGILLESGTDEGQLWIVVGIGMNICAAPDVEQSAIAPTFLNAGLQKDQWVDAEQAAQTLFGRYEHWANVYVNDGFAPIRESWTRKACGLGGQVIARLPNKEVSGTAMGLDEDGALLIKTDQGAVVKIHAGDVFFS